MQKQTADQKRVNELEKLVMKLQSEVGEVKKNQYEPLRKLTPKERRVLAKTIREMVVAIATNEMKDYAKAIEKLSESTVTRVLKEYAEATGR